MFLWKPKKISVINIADKISKIECFKFFNATPLSIAIDIIGVKLGGCGINLLAANRTNILNIALL